MVLAGGLGAEAVVVAAAAAPHERLALLRLGVEAVAEEVAGAAAAVDGQGALVWRRIKRKGRG